MTLRDELASTAARLVVEEGLDYGPAKRKAAKMLGVPPRQLPDNDAIEDAVREHIALFCADTQPAELAALRDVARRWMERLAEFRPHLSGAVWRGTATRLTPITLQLFCDDTKGAEIALINMGIDYDVDGAPGPRGVQVDVLIVSARSQILGQPVTLRLVMLDRDDMRGALRCDARGRSPCGDAKALERLLQSQAR